MTLSLILLLLNDWFQQVFCLSKETGRSWKFRVAFCDSFLPMIARINLSIFHPDAIWEVNETSTPNGIFQVIFLVGQM